MIRHPAKHEAAPSAAASPGVQRRAVLLPLLLLLPFLVPFLAVFLAVLAGTPAEGSAARTEPFVVASIKPIHGLVAAVMAGVAEPGLLVTGTGSLHTQTMLPSQARMLSRARLIFWVGPSLETVLPKALAALGQQARSEERRGGEECRSRWAPYH